MKMKSANYEYFHEFAEAVVIAEMKRTIASERWFMKKHGEKKQTDLLKAAKVILEYYT